MGAEGWGLAKISYKIIEGGAGPKITDDNDETGCKLKGDTILQEEGGVLKRMT